MSTATRKTTAIRNAIEKRLEDTMMVDLQAVGREYNRRPALTRGTRTRDGDRARSREPTTEGPTVTPDAPRPDQLPCVEEMLEALHRAGWSIGDVALDYPTGRVWVVSGTNGENRIVAEGR